ncbi:MAG TPA: peptidyl-prolyl cis-trans isomerase [Pyrinomonadaceae bacterium]|nr:peptidyl-prolyl cis-trans isomerase [Pyrinomonadaceae bacterium]
MSFKNISARAWPLLLAALALTVLSAAPARAQEEGVPVVLDEPVVQVNNDVILLSQLKRENREFKEVLVKQRGVSEQEADAQIAQKQAEVIFGLINESLIMQKGKDLPRITEEVEAEVNREILRVASREGIKSIEDLETAMRAEGVLLSDIRETLRRQYTQQAVLQREVDAKTYYGLTDAELRKYYDANRAKFQSVTLSEIFLSLAGRSEAEVLAKAKDLIGRARANADFGELAAKNSEREREGVRVAEKTKGRLEEDGKPRWFLVAELQTAISNAIKDLPAGGVSEPIKVDEGYLILRVNERDDAFKENHVRGVLAQERLPKDRENYLRGLRREAYIMPAKEYKAVIQPLLDKDKAETASQPDSQPKPKEKK